jgi:hypothetical protein
MKPKIQRAGKKMKLFNIAITGVSFLTLLAPPVFADSEQLQAQQGWVNCGDDASKQCLTNTTDLITIRHGLDGRFTYTAVEGLESPPCNNFVGDPDPGNNKTCWFTKTNPLDVPDKTTFSFIAKGDTGNTFDVSPEGLYWVRYGTQGRWIYAIVRGGGVETVPCNEQYFGTDPYVNQHKTCELGAAFTRNKNNDTFAQCASDVNKGPCQTSTIRPMIASYGVDGSYLQRVILNTNGEYPCGNTQFGHDPKVNTHKFCYAMDFLPKAGTTIASWKLLQSCNSNKQDCGTATISTEISSTYDEKISTEKSWSLTVSESLEEKIILDDGTIDLKAGISTTIKDAITDTFGHSKTESRTIQQACGSPADPTSSIYVYQFETTTPAICLQDSSCSLQTQTQSIYCEEVKTGHEAKTPKCLPGSANCGKLDN